jgi:hypothetical protein
MNEISEIQEVKQDACICIVESIGWQEWPGRNPVELFNILEVNPPTLLLIQNSTVTEQTIEKSGYQVKINSRESI